MQGPGWRTQGSLAPCSVALHDYCLSALDANPSGRAPVEEGLVVAVVVVRSSPDTKEG